MKVEPKCVKRPDGWWVTGIPDGEDMGEYATKAEAEEAARGTVKFYRLYVNDDGTINNRKI